MKLKEQELSPRLKKVGTAIWVFLAPFYLCWLLPMIAKNPVRAGSLGNGIFFLLYAQVWLTTWVYAMRAAAAFYGLTPPRIFFRFELNQERQRGWVVVALMFVSYALTIYGFGLAYIYLSSVDRAAFNRPIGITDGMYFSVVTAATVGYGDVLPLTRIAKALTISEIGISLLYVVLLFSVASSYSRDLRGSRSKSPETNGPV